MSATEIHTMLAADGSSSADTRTVVIDRKGEDWGRWRCPNGHHNWDATNEHIWCPECRRQYEAGADVHPEHWELLDKKTGEMVPWSAIEIIEPDQWEPR